MQHACKSSGGPPPSPVSSSGPRGPPVYCSYLHKATRNLRKTEDLVTFLPFYPAPFLQNPISVKHNIKCCFLSYKMLTQDMKFMRQDLCESKTPEISVFAVRDMMIWVLLQPEVESSECLHILG